MRNVVIVMRWSSEQCIVKIWLGILLFVVSLLGPHIELYEETIRLNRCSTNSTPTEMIRFD